MQGLEAEMSSQVQPLKSCPCTQAQLETEPFQSWCDRLRQPRGHLHRKVWEWCYVAQALYERDLLQPGRRGLGFAVGQEPLAALFATFGCDIVATDQNVEQATAGNWVATGQHALSTEQLNLQGICPPDRFEQHVTFRPVDMRAIPADLRNFDFIWSCCSLEHLGSLALAEQFVLESLRCLRPGGVAVHTTEYNVSSNFFTLRSGPTVLLRQRDIQRLARKLRTQGHGIELDFTTGDLPVDRLVDRPPYRTTQHLKLKIGWFVATSFGLIIHKANSS
jgi:SAM-dependent methyltransferase